MQHLRKMGVLKSYICFQLLDHIAEKYGSGDDCVRKLISSFVECKKDFSDADVLSCISCKETTLALLAGMIFFIRSNNLGSPEQDKFQWSNHLENKQGISEGEDARVWAIKIMRNAIAHWGEGK